MQGTKSTQVTQNKPHGAYLSLDAWRGAACVWVVMYHVRNLIVEHDADAAHTLLFIISSFGEHGVDIFFVISGYCIAHAAVSAAKKPNGPLNFITARVRRIYPPYLAATVLATALLLALQTLLAHYKSIGSLPSDYTHSQSLLFYATNLTLTQNVFHQGFALKQAWTLCYEAAFYLIFATLTWIAAKMSRPEVILTASHCLSFGTLLLLIVVPGRVNYPFDLLPLFGIGANAYDVLMHKSSIRSWAWLVAMGALMIVHSVLAIESHIGAVSPYNNEPEVLSFVVAVLVSILLITLHSLDAKLIASKAIRPVATVGFFSYSLYLTHGFIIFLLHLLLARRAVNEYATFFTGVTASLVFGWAFFLIAERPFLSNYRKKIIVDEQPIHH
jgi:exopolysaccharide production protein ExoZ